MIASWVAQASFEPLGLTIAVAKDRAIESLMQVGDSFVLNCLPEGNFQPTMKHFLKRFPPGADRFEGIRYACVYAQGLVVICTIQRQHCASCSQLDGRPRQPVSSAERRAGLHGVQGGEQAGDARSLGHILPRGGRQRCRP